MISEYPPRSTLYDADGNPIKAYESGDGGYRLSTHNTISGDHNPERTVWISPLEALTTNTTFRLVGKSFDGTVKDPNFWSETGTVNGGSVTQSGDVTLATNTTANGAAKYQTTHKARFAVSRPNKFFGFFKFDTALVANNLRRIGAYDVNNGFFMQVNGTTFSVGRRRATSDTLVTNGSFNGNLGATWNPGIDQYYRLIIEYGEYGASFYVNGALLHTLPIASYVDELNLPITMESINSGGSIINSNLKCLGATIVGEGQLKTQPVHYYHALGVTPATGVTLKYGAGVIHGIILNNCLNNAVVTLSNSTSVLTSPFFSFVSGKDFLQPAPIDFHGTEFSSGLRLGVTVANACLTVIYE